MTSKNSSYTLFLIFLIAISLVLIVIQNTVFTGKATESGAVSNVSISKYLSMSFSGNLSQGIYFGTVEELPALNINATEDYTNLLNGTMYYVNISSDSNSNMDICIKANEGLVNGALDVIGLGNQTYSNSTTTNDTTPELGEEVSLTISYVKSGNNLLIGGENYYRFWLDVPVGQPSGDYENTLSFKGVETGISC